MSELLAKNISFNTGYAEKMLRQRDMFDQYADVIMSRFKNLVFTRKSTKQITEMVNGYHEFYLSSSDAELLKEFRSLKISISRRGINLEDVSMAFAIVREMAFRKIGMRHYDVQVMGGWVLLNGKVAEMETGEGKTLTATLPACVMALLGIPVHIITVNDYLAERDAHEMSDLYHALGFSVGLIQQGMSPEQRKREYSKDITYCTNKELIFDYLKDRITIGNNSGYTKLRLENIFRESTRLDDLILRGLHFGIVDEADSVLADEARVPAIISASTENTQEDDSFRYAYQLAMSLEEGEDYHTSVTKHNVEFTDDGIERINLLTNDMPGVWARKRWREEMIRLALVAYHTYFNNKHYIVRDEKVQIIDEYTGRAMPDRSWEKGLHQMVEIKESVPLTSQKEPLAKISYQKFFRRYLCLSGMTGTAKEIQNELARVYSLDVVKIPTHRSVIRKYSLLHILPTAEKKWKFIAGQVKQLNHQGIPVLIGTRTVVSSEVISDLLNKQNLSHKVLNASQDQNEANIISSAGISGSITVATNMAGRGTDIKINQHVKDLGGLHVITAERNESSRIDRQLFGRCARQGDPGVCINILSLEDEILTTHISTRLLQLTGFFLGHENKALNRIAVMLSHLLLVYSQNRTERLYAKVRINLLKKDQKMSDFLAFAGYKE